ncbi:hypothetical protein [Enterococcus sp.]|uniref:hypothetical protein n=1 Tax=Enterococcus sp. TaxID=35783 RepID=UPI002FCB2AF3
MQLDKSTKILVISNNTFSKTLNNGKTLASFFKGIHSSNIAQLYFSSENPDFDLCQNYYRISDKQILTSLFKSSHAGGIIDQEEFYKSKNNVDSYKYRKKNNFTRLIREIMWKTKKWKSNELMNWVSRFSPDIIFFCAGDTAFTYDITEEIINFTGAKLITYITDDYILPRKKASLFWQIRRNVIFKKMKKALEKSSLFVTISEEMSKTYNVIFNKDSIVALNMTESMKLNNEIKNNKDKEIQLVYAGGLHFKRNETLKYLSGALEKYNRSTNGKKAILKIYSNEKPSGRILKDLNIEGVSTFLGGVDTETLKIKLNEADIPVHVESFDSISMESTKLSLSTKIPEYLSLEKPVLAVGPSEVSSMKYLQDCAFCIVDKNELYSKLTILLDNEEIRKNLSRKAKEKYIKNHDPEKMRKKLQDKILSVVNEVKGSDI